MNDAVDLGMSSEDFVELILLCKVNLVESWSLAGNELDAVESNLGRIV